MFFLCARTDVPIKVQVIFVRRFPKKGTDIKDEYTILSALPALRAEIVIGLTGCCIMDQLLASGLILSPARTG